MSADSQLAGMFVRIYAKGLDTVQSSMGVARRATEALKAGFERVQGSVDQFAGSAAKLAATFGISGGIFGYFAHGAAQGTVEAERLSQAFNILQRIIGQQLAPYFRMLTQAVLEVAKWWNSLDRGLRESITKWAVITAAVATFIGVMASVLTLITTVGGAFATMATAIAGVLGPWGVLAVAAIAAATAIVGAILWMTAEGNTWEEKMDSVLKRILHAWIVFGSSVEGIIAGIGAHWDNMVAVLEHGINAKLKDPIQVMLQTQKESQAIVEKGINAWMGGKSPVGAIKDLMAPFLAAWEKIKAAGSSGLGFTRGEARLETSQARYDRLLMDAVNGKLGTDEQMLKELIKINENWGAGIMIKNLPGPVPAVK